VAGLPLQLPSRKPPAPLSPARSTARRTSPGMHRLDADAATGVWRPHITRSYEPDSPATLFTGDCRKFLPQIPDGAATLVVTSPPYNLGKSYESKRSLEDYISDQDAVIGECARILGNGGSICWQVGNHVDGGEVFPLDILLYPLFKKRGLELRNRIIWTFGHGLHCSRRFSGRYETILWFTKGEQYTFNLDAVRVPSKYPNKRYFKGPRKGEISGNPLGKNPTDVWAIPNVKFNHVEKTDHPCQFPVELVERLVLALTNEDDLIVDPFMGVGSAPAAAVLHRRRAAGADIIPRYVVTARERVRLALAGELRTRPMSRPIYEPPARVLASDDPIQ